MATEINRVKILLEDLHLLSINVRQYVHKRLSGLKLDVTYEMVRVLMLLHQKGAMNQQQIADFTFKNKASLTSLVDNLQKRNLVIRKEDQIDRRNKIIEPTEKGIEIAGIVIPIFEEILGKLYDDVSEKELEVMSKIINKMNSRIA